MYLGGIGEPMFSAEGWYQKDLFGEKRSLRKMGQLGELSLAG